jgi:CRISPR-associated endonuclease/helicase Cas3
VCSILSFLKIGVVEVSYYAHLVKLENSLVKRQLLEDHLLNVAKMASAFAKKFKAQRWGYAAGLWHDIGKYSEKFQEKLRRAETDEPDIRVDHSTYGAKLIFEKERFGKILAYCIAGHHAGLPNATGDSSSLNERLHKDLQPLKLDKIPKNILSLPQLETDFLREWFNGLPPKQRAFGYAFFIRMLFSSLVDADFLDTERFVSPEKTLKRNSYPSLEELREVFRKKLKEFQEKKFSENEILNKIRNDIYEECVNAAQETPGFFSLTVPTGGGKTLSSLAFAFEHAKKYGLYRIIYVIPYTSIIEQNAAIFRKFCGENSVIEHHSNYVQKDSKDDEEETRMLATENWDAPIIVTTNVQFFESLFTNRSSRARKLHNIAKSVIILDEAQMIPIDYLIPSMEALRELVDHYSSTVVLCTATQPALNDREGFSGLKNVREIVSNPKELSIKLKRVREEYIGEISQEELAKKLASEKQVLCVVNSRREALELYEDVEKEVEDEDHNGVYHLSALMCPAHRSKNLNNIRNSLNAKEKCRVISTQLIEAGVDIDFPVVYRSLASLDSIAQAAGRCNREGKMEYGKLFVFKPQKGIPPITDFRARAEETEAIIRKSEKSFLSLEMINEFFESFYWRKGENLDKKGIIQDCLQGIRELNFQFRDIARKFKIIEDNQISILIPYDENASTLIQSLKFHVSINTLRKLQRYTVQVPERVFKELQRVGYVESIGEGLWTLSQQGMKEAYSEETGLTIQTPEFYQAENMIL